MKNIKVSFLLLFFTLAVYSQDTELKKIEQVGDLYEVTLYYEDGNIMQHGFLNKDMQLHASWESFYNNGNRKCVAFYENGAKVGTWFYWFLDKKTKVVYENNKIVEVEDLPLE